MIIKKLYLTSFGKFYKKELELSDGINLVKGLNEAGKSTIHKFIEGMLFGFYKTGGKNRSLNEFHQMYMPRSRSEYLGSMIVEFKGIEYFIERDFKKTNPIVKITDNKTGKDLTDKIPYNNATRLPDVAALLEIDYTMYSNTISVTQMGSETGKDLASVVTEKLTNLNTTKDESISLAKVNNKLNSKIDDIGTKKSKTKPLYQSIQKKSDLENELIKSEESYKEISLYQVRINEIETELDLTRESLSKLDTQKSIYENEKLKLTYYKVEKLITEKELLHTKANNLQEFNILDKKDYEEAVIIEMKLSEIKKQQEKLGLELEKLLKQSSELELSIQENTYLINNKIEYLDVYEEYIELNSIKKELNNYKEEIERLTSFEKSSINISDLKEDYIKYRENIKVDYEQLHKEVNTDLLHVENEKRALESTTPKRFYRILSFVLIFTIVFSFVRVIQNKKIKRIEIEKNNLNQKIDELQKKSNEINNKKQKQDLEIKDLLAKYKVKSDVEFEILYQENSSKAQMEELNKERIGEINTKIPIKELRLKELSGSLENIFQNITDSTNISSINLEKTKDKIAKYSILVENNNILSNNILIVETKLSEFNKEFDLLMEKNMQIFDNNKIDNLIKFKTGLDQKVKYLEYNVKINTLEIRIKDYLGELSFEDFSKQINFDDSINFDEEIYTTLITKEGYLRKLELTLNTERSSILEKIKYIENDNRDLALIKNEINFNTEKLNEMEINLKAINLVKKILDELSNEISYEFAPALNDEVSKVVNKVTNGRYNDVKLDRNLDVKMFDSTANKIESIYGFSKGTIDQVYLAMRFGINKVVSENTNPFILDDSFVNYDNDRLEKVISIIAEDSKQEKRQVIIFSCQDREDELISKMKVEANIITI